MWSGRWWLRLGYMGTVRKKFARGTFFFNGINYYTTNFMTGPCCTQLTRCPRLPGRDPLLTAARLTAARLQPAVGLPQRVGTAAVAGGEGLEGLPQQ